MATIIADTACVDPRAELDDGVEIGPHCVVGPEARIGRGTRLVAHCVVQGRTSLGAGNVVHPFAVLGGEPPEIPPRGRGGRLEIGDGNVLREHVVVHAGPADPEGLTRLGNRILLMPAVHVGPGSTVEDLVTLGDGALLAEEVVVGPQASVSAGVSCHRRLTIGAFSFVGVLARIHHDVPPYMLVDGDPARVRSINLIGLKRRGVSKPGIDALREAHRLLFRARADLDEVGGVLESRGHLTPEVQALLAALRAQRAGRHGRALEESVESADSIET